MRAAEVPTACFQHIDGKEIFEVVQKNINDATRAGINLDEI